MKTVLVLTDFSENSKHAAKAAVLLAAKMHAGILLFNTILQNAEIPAYAEGAFFADGLSRWKDASKESLDELSAELETFLDSRYLEEGEKRPPIEVLFGEGNLDDQIAIIAAHKDITMIVMGGRSASAIDHMLFGSDTSRVIEKATKPVLVIPQNANMDNICTILFATNYEPADLKALDYIEDISGSVPFKLKVVHITLPDSNKKGLDFDKLAIARKLEHMHNTRPVLEELNGSELNASLHRVCEENGADVLAIVHRPSGIFRQLFSQGTTLAVLKQRKMPLLVFPPDMI